MIVTIIRTVVVYMFVTVGIRLMGKRQIGDMQPNELVITLLISEIAAIPLQDASQPVVNGMVAIFILVIVEIVMSVLTMKSMYLRKILSGKSVIVIKNGEIDQQAMKKVRLTVIDLIELLRGQNIFDITTVDYAVLEVNGNLSVLLKAGYQPATAKDVNAKLPREALPLPVISDGKPVNESIKALGISEDTVDSLAQVHHLKTEDIFLMTLDRYGNCTAVKKEDNL